VNNKTLESFFAIHDSIRSFSIIGKDGNLIFAKMRDGVKSYAPELSIDLYSARIALHVAMGETENLDHGKVRFSMVVREKIVLLMFPGFGKIFVVSARTDFPFECVEKIGQLIDELAEEFEPFEAAE